MTLSTSAVAVCCSRASLSSRCACARRHSRSVVDSWAIAAVPCRLPSFDAAPRGTIEILRDARKRLNALRPRSTKGSPPVRSWPGKFDSPARRRGDRIGGRRKDFLKCKPSGRPAYMRWRHLIFERRVANDGLVQVKLPDLRLAHLQNAAQDVFVMLAKTIRLQLSPRRPTREFCSKTWNIEFPDLPILDPAHSAAFAQMRMTHAFV